MTAISDTELPVGGRLRRLPALLATLAALYVAGFVACGALLTADVSAWQLLSALPLFAVAAWLCVLRAARVERDRRAWRLMAASIVCYPIGSLGLEYSTISDGVSSVAHGGWLLAYVLAYLAITDLGRAAVRPYPLGYLLDGFVVAFAAFSVAALAFELVAALPYRPWDVVLGFAYPLIDAILVSTVLMIAWVGRGGGSRLWRRLFAGFGAILVADIAFLVITVTSGYSAQAAYHALYPLAMLLLASAAWLRPPTPVALRWAPAGSLLVPGGAVLVCVAVVGVQLGVQTHGPAAIVALATIVAAFLRAGVVFHDLAIVREQRRYSETGLHISRAALRQDRQDLLLPHVVDELARATGNDVIALVLEPDEAERDAEVVAAAGVTHELRAALSSAPAPLERVVRDASRGTGGAPIDEAARALHGALRQAGLDGLEIVPIDPTIGPPAAVCVGSGQQHRSMGAEDRRFLELAANVIATALDRKRREVLSHRRALHDPLTGLANRALLLAHLEHAIEHGRRGAGLVGVVLFDLDGFKAVNDTLGHATGDGLLKEVATILRATTRGGDLLARLGGDEFVVVFDSVESAEQIEPFVKRLVGRLGQPIGVGDRDVLIGASVGVVAQSPEGATAESLLADADVAMYRAKQRGGHRHEFFDAHLRAGLARRAAIEQQLRRAIEDGELRLAYQPQIAIDGTGVTGFEALLRWERVGDEPLSPAHFVPIAEEAGLSEELAAWTLREACRWIATIDRRGCRLPRVAVNLAPRQITPALPDLVDSALEASGLVPRRLCLEVREAALAAEGPQRTILDRLRARGVTLSLDDFGTGSSSIGALQRHAVDELKIDRSLISTVDGVAATRALARALVDMAGAFGLQVVAEGVERERQLDVVRELGCGVAQGFLFSPAMWADDVDTYLGSGTWRQPLGAANPGD